MTKEEYRAYLQSPHWKEVSAQCKERYDNKCAICGSTEDLNVHHWTYERIGDEHPQDLICLCRSCHKHAHDIQDSLTESLRRLYTNRDEGLYPVEQLILAQEGYKLLGDHRTKHLPKIMNALERILAKMKSETYFRRGPDTDMDRATQILKDLRTKK